MHIVVSLSRARCEGLDHSGEEVLAPNQLIVTLDAAHSSKRFLSRSFKCGGDMEKWFEEYVVGQYSIVQVIQNSDQFRSWFEAAVQSLDPESSIGGGGCFNLGMAKHRFISVKKRLSRFIGKYLAVFQVAEQIRMRRAGKAEAQVAVNFLDGFGAEQFLQLAMMADAADEAYMYGSFADDEQMDLALQASEVAIFIENINYLFVGEQCLVVEGHTKFARDQLKEVKLLNVSKARRGSLVMLCRAKLYAAPNL